MNTQHLQIIFHNDRLTFKDLPALFRHRCCFLRTWRQRRKDMAKHRIHEWCTCQKVWCLMVLIIFHLECGQFTVWSGSWIYWNSEKKHKTQPGQLGKAEELSLYTWSFTVLQWTTGNWWRLCRFSISRFFTKLCKRRLGRCSMGTFLAKAKSTSFWLQRAFSLRMSLHPKILERKHPMCAWFITRSFTS